MFTDFLPTLGTEMEKRTQRAAYWLITAFFLLIAWATSIEEPQEIRSLPLAAQAESAHIWLKSDATYPVADLSLVLNGIYTFSPVNLGPQAELRIPLSSFTDRSGATLPAEEKPHVLEVYQNGDNTPRSGGYSKFRFD